MRTKKRWFKRGNPLRRTYFHSMGGNASDSWRGRLCSNLSIWWGDDGAGFGAGNRQADLLPGHLGALRSGVRLQVFLGGGPLATQVADLHDVSNDLHGSGDSLFTWWDVIFHLLQVRSRSPALFILVPAIVIITYLFVSNDRSGTTCAKALLPQSLFIIPLFTYNVSQSVCLPDKPPAFQVLLNNLHNDSLLKGDFILPLAGVRLHCHVLLFCQEQSKDSAQCLGTQPSKTGESCTTYLT